MTWLRRSLFILASWLAYGLLTPLYEAAAWLFSNGEWHTWRRQAVVMLAGQATATGVRPRILEVGCGTGALLAELSAAGSLVVGLDRSASMLHAAARRLRQGGLTAERATINLGADDHVHRHGLSSNSEMRSAQGAPVIPVQGLAQAIPLPAASMDCIILTFPTAFVFDLRNVPMVIQAISQILPATHFMGLIKTLFMAGDYWPDILRDCTILAIYAALLIELTRRALAKRLD